MKPQYSILVFLFCFNIPNAAQNFYLDENGVTIKCEDCQPGDTGMVNGILYEAVDRSLLEQRRDEGADLTLLCTSPVTDMGHMFYQADSFNQDIGSWDVSNVTNMSGMFGWACNFDQDIGAWDVSKVTDMSRMFDSHTDAYYRIPHSFNHDIGAWDVSKVTDMSGMFNGSEFNQDIGSWNVSLVTNMSGMFSTTPYDHDIGGWDVSNVTNMSWMFYGADSFNQDIGLWDVSNVTDMGEMFFAAGSFDQDISTWDVENVINMTEMFRGASSFNHDINLWEVRNVTDMSYMFKDATNFNQDLSGWCVEKITIEPENFATDCPLKLEYYPVWGTCSTQDSMVSIPDTAFLYALIDVGVDMNGDSVISYGEAALVDSINVSSREIVDIKGIEAFINLNSLDCSNNELTSLDVSGCTILTYLKCTYCELSSLDLTNNPKLQYLDCSLNQPTFTSIDLTNNPELYYLDCSVNPLLTSLDVSGNPKLKYLDCGGYFVIVITQLATLDVSNNTELEYLRCGSSQLTNLDLTNNKSLKHLDCSITQLDSLDLTNLSALEDLTCGFANINSLDVSYNTALIFLSCRYTQLTNLDISKNTQLEILDIRDNPNLTEVCVWTTPFPPEGVNVNTENSPNVYFTTECTIGIEDMQFDNITIYPNPTNTILIIETDISDFYNIEIAALNGQWIFTEQMEGTTHQIDLSSFQKGVYFITIKSKDFVTTRKIVKL